MKTTNSPEFNISVVPCLPHKKGQQSYKVDSISISKANTYSRRFNLAFDFDSSIVFPTLTSYSNSTLAFDQISIAYLVLQLQVNLPSILFMDLISEIPETFLESISLENSRLEGSLGSVIYRTLPQVCEIYNYLLTYEIQGDCLLFYRYLIKQITPILLDYDCSNV